MVDTKKIEKASPEEINKSIEYLKRCQDYTTKEAAQHISMLDSNTRPSFNPEYKTVSKNIGDSGIGSIIPKFYDALFEYLDSDASGSSGVGTISIDILEKMTNISANATNHSAECGRALARSGGIPLLFKALKQIKNAKTKNPHQNMGIFMILHNAIRLCRSNVSYYRQAEVNAVAILKGYLGESDHLTQCLSLMILAYITTDSEKKELASTELGVRVLIKILKTASTVSSSHTAIVGSGECSTYFSAFEILDAINQLAINDSVKKAIADEDGIPAIVKMLQDDFSPEEQKVAAETVWNLAFVESIRKSDILQQTIPTLKNLTKSEDKEVRRACVSALFEIQADIIVDPGTPSSKTPNTPPPSYHEAISEPAPTATNQNVQIMISYQWDSQERAKQIRDNLAAAGYKIWMDVTNMRGDILKAMAEAIERSDVILICMTEQYKDSQNCRSEASYAFKLKKKIIPLLLQKDYKPDGWLGLVQGMDLYYSFHSDEGVNESMGELVKALGEQARSEKARSNGGEFGGPIRPISQVGYPQEVTTSKQSTPTAAEWSKEDVQRWLRDNDLTELCEKFRRFGGRHLKMKYDQYCKDEEKFEERMKFDYGMDDAIYTDFIVKLQDAFKN